MRGRSGSLARFRRSSGSSSTSQASSMATKVERKRHPHFYFEDGSLVLLVENVLFKVFRSMLTRHSVVFADVFTMSPSDEEEGKTDENPLILDGILSVDFERFMEALLPRSPGSYALQSVEEWKSVLALATRWEVEPLRALTMKHFETLSFTDFDAVDRILLSHEYDYNNGNWAFPAYMHLCVRADALTGSEIARLGPEKSAQIAQIRERSMDLKKGFSLSQPERRRAGPGASPTAAVTTGDATLGSGKVGAPGARGAQHRYHYHTTSSGAANLKPIAMARSPSLSPSAAPPPAGHKYRTRPPSPTASLASHATRPGPAARLVAHHEERAWPDCFGNAKVASWITATFSISPNRSPAQ